MKTKPLKYPKTYGVRDEFGALYSADGTKLLKYDNDDLETYSVREGTKIICDGAFLHLDNRNFLKKLHDIETFVTFAL